MIIPLALLLLSGLVVVAVPRVFAAVHRPATAVAGPAVPWRPTAVVVRRSTRASLLSLGWVEGRRMLTHPIALTGFLLMLVVTGFVRPGGRHEAFVQLTGGGPAGMYLPTLVFFAANLTATRTRRSRATELLGAAPTDQERRTAALCVGALVPATAALAYVLLSLAVYRAGDVYVAHSPAVAELMLLPLSVLGAGTLGVMVARWAPWRGVPIVVFVGLVALTLYAHQEHSGWYGSYLDLIEWESLERLPGSAAWHAAYLLGLDTMAAVGAVLRDTSRRREVLAVGAVVTLATIGAGWAQLP